MVDHGEISRSHFLRSGLRTFMHYAVDAAHASAHTVLERSLPPLHRPPGAADELTFLARCTRCDRCIDACPHNALIQATERHGAAVGTPLIEPAEAPCYLCEDFPCIGACPEKALTPGNVTMGTAHLIYTKCFAYRGQVCDYCFTGCPLKGEAVVMENGKPRIYPDQCSGCGICEYLCPAPGKGIMVAPDRNRGERRRRELHGS